ncbi:MAG: aminopeptidase P N-terminal domain-containing protein [Eubacteriales bacterium]|nr:aminopeptidase P N-terminal domain-containing protein [Eubacteriales bacterium]
MNIDFYRTNRRKILDGMEDEAVMIIFSGQAKYKSHDQFYKYVPNKSFYYLSGFDKEKSILVLSKFRKSVQEMLFIEKPDSYLELYHGKMTDKEDIVALTGIETVHYIEDLMKILSKMFVNNYYRIAYLDYFKRGIRAIPTEEMSFAELLEKNFPYLKMMDAFPLIANQRKIKTEEEIEAVKEAVKLTELGLNSILEHLKPGCMEYELEAHFQFAMKMNGGGDYAFDPIIASGKNGVLLHYGENNSQINDNELVLIDIGAEYGYYASDISRTYPSSGRFTPRQKELYEAVLEAEEEIIRALKPGMPIDHMRNIADDILAKRCIEIGLIKEKEEIIRYLYHGVGHYIGLDTHDVGDRDILEPGMVLTVEPGLYIKEEGIGIRIEDDVLITENGCDVLSKDIIKSVNDIEQAMRRN